MITKIALPFCFLIANVLAGCSNNSTTETYVSPPIPSTPTPVQSPSPSAAYTALVESLRNPGTQEALLHVEGVRKVPLAKSKEDFYELDNAISIKNDDPKALAMIRRGKIAMVDNDSLVVIVEPFGYLTRIRLKKNGQVGWVKSAWLE